MNAPDPQAPYTVVEAGANVWRMSFMFDVEGTAPAIAKFRTKNLIDAIFQMMDADQGVRLKGAIAAGEAAQWIRGIAYIGDTEAVTHPFDLEAFERMRNEVMRAAMESGAVVEGVGGALDDAAALRRLRESEPAAGPETASDAAQTGEDDEALD